MAAPERLSPNIRRRPKVPAAAIGEGRFQRPKNNAGEHHDYFGGARQPSKQILDIADSFGCIDGRRRKSFPRHHGGTMASYAASTKCGARPAVKYPRDSGYRPDAEETVQRWYWRCEIKGGRRVVAASASREENIA
jgi:hypothetical protein